MAWMPETSFQFVLPMERFPSRLEGEAFKGFRCGISRCSKPDHEKTGIPSLHHDGEGSENTGDSTLLAAGLSLFSLARRYGSRLTEQRAGPSPLLQG